jgi:hypothetical protein
VAAYDGSAGRGLRVWRAELRGGEAEVERSGLEAPKVAAYAGSAVRGLRVWRAELRGGEAEVERSGLEPPTPGLQSRCSTN